MRKLTHLEKYRQTDAEKDLYGVDWNGYEDDRLYNGIFKVYVEGRSFHVIASTGGGWDHVSVSPCNVKRNKCPTWEEMSAIKDMFFEPEECVVQYHPAKAEYVNNHPLCLHLWRPQETELPAPPKLFV